MPRHVLGSTADLPALRAQLEALAAAGEHARVIEMLFELLARVTREHSDLAARYLAMLRQMYRSKSERISSDQLALFFAQLPANGMDQPPEEPPPPPPPPPPAAPPGPVEGSGDAPPTGPDQPDKPKRGGRKPLPSSMRREITKVPTPEDERHCCGAEKTLIGTHIRVTIEYRPGEAYAVEEHAEVRACKICEGNVTTAPTTPPPIEGARPGPGMLAQIVTSKNSRCRAAGAPEQDPGPRRRADRTVDARRLVRKGRRPRRAIASSAARRHPRSLPAQPRRYRPGRAGPRPRTRHQARSHLDLPG